MQRAMLVFLAFGLLVVAPAPGKTLNAAVLVGSDGAWVRVAGSANDFENLGRDFASKPQRTKGSYVRLYFVGPGEFPANRARYYPRQRCVALDWPSYQRSCVALKSKLVPTFRRSHRLARFTERPTILSRLRYPSSTASIGLAAVTGSVELSILRKGVTSSEPIACYRLTGTWKGPVAADRPKRLLLCRSGVFADGRLHPLNRAIWEWFRRNVGPPEPPPKPPTVEQPTTCAGDEVQALAARFVASFNEGNLEELDRIFAQEPDFEWYVTGAPGERVELQAASDRESLVPYFRERHEVGERLTMNSFRFNGNSRGPRIYGNFEYTLTRSANDLVPTAFGGKGAALCFEERPDQIIVWAMARR
jgi:hypothetical protein